MHECQDKFTNSFSTSTNISAFPSSETQRIVQRKLCSKQTPTVGLPCLVDFLLGGFEGLDDAVQLDAARQEALLELGLLVLQPAQLPLGAAHFILLAAQVALLGADLALQRRYLASE